MKSKTKANLLDDASEYVLDMRPVYHEGSVYIYADNHYRLVKEPKLDLAAWYQGRGDFRSNSQLASVETQVRAMTRSDQKLPYWRDGREGEYIAFANGILDLGAWRRDELDLHAHTPEWVSSSCLPYKFVPEAQCPQWMEFLHQVFEGDESRIDLLGEWCGYCMTQDTSRQKLMIFDGPPRAGKGTILRMLANLVGDRNSIWFKLKRLIDRFSIRALVDKQLAIFPDAKMPQGDAAEIYETLISIVGEDAQTIEGKNKDVEHSAFLPTRILIACNGIPHMWDDSGALAARLLVLPFRMCFAGREDIELEDRLATELPGIAQWALRGLARLDRQGWTKSTLSAERHNETRRESSPTLAFMQDCMVVHSALSTPMIHGVTLTEERVEVTVPALKERYEQWCLEKECNQGMRMMGKTLKQVLPHLPSPDGHKRTLPNGTVVRSYVGIGLK